jgi:hypothetical protein
MLDHAVYLYGFNLSRAEALVQDLSAEQMVAQPAGLINHPSWSLGHLVVSADGLGRLLGLESSLPESWRETFKTGGEPSGEASDYPEKAAILDALREHHGRNTQAVKTCDASVFAEPHPDERRRKVFPTIGDLALFLMTSHEYNHLGQIAAWRRAMGLGSATGR